jgi:hypothetical protein
MTRVWGVLIVNARDAGSVRRSRGKFRGYAPSPQRHLRTYPMLWAGTALLAVIWLSTAVVQVPCHEVLSRVFDSEVYQSLVSTNWIGTAAWSLRGLLLLWMVWSLHE